jgi:hypothetical protein
MTVTVAVTAAALTATLVGCSEAGGDAGATAAYAFNNDFEPGYKAFRYRQVLIEIDPELTMYAYQNDRWNLLRTQEDLDARQGYLGDDSSALLMLVEDADAPLLSLEVSGSPRGVA